MTALAAFCPVDGRVPRARDLFVPHVRDVEVWFGFELHGTAARSPRRCTGRSSRSAHGGSGARGRGSSRAAAVYVFYVALSHLVWSEASPNGNGWPIGLAQAAAISVPGFLLLRARR